MVTEHVMRKTDLALQTLVDDGGYLLPAQSNKFLRGLMESPTLLKQIRVVPMKSHTKNIDKIGLNSRILRPGNVLGSDSSDRALAVGDRFVPTFGQVVLSTVKVLGETRLTYETFEDNIEGTALTNTIMDMLIERVSVDLEELLIFGDTSSGDEYLAQMNGILEWAESDTSNIVDHGGEPVSKDLFAEMQKALPVKYRRNRNKMKYFVARDLDVDYRNAVADRSTSLGDSALLGDRELPVLGVPMSGVDQLLYANVIYTNPKNFLFGIWRQIMIETERLISEQQVKIVVSMRLGFQVEEDEAFVLSTNVAGV